MSKDKQLADRVLKQLFFDIAVRAMKRQGKPGMQGKMLGLRCGDGSKCSLGHLIDDKLYKPKFETLCPNAVMIDILGMPKLDFVFYDDIQQAHDTSAKATNWWPAFAREMRLLATKHFLNPRSLAA